ncbi:unnamed protein product [Lampetra fluviatilis]
MWLVGVGRGQAGPGGALTDARVSTRGGNGIDIGSAASAMETALGVALLLQRASCKLRGGAWPVGLVAQGQKIFGQMETSGQYVGRGLGKVQVAVMPPGCVPVSASARSCLHGSARCVRCTSPWPRRVARQLRSPLPVVAPFRGARERAQSSDAAPRSSVGSCSP